jgi:hypothetical protein
MGAPKDDIKILPKPSEQFLEENALPDRTAETMKCFLWIGA